jgi:hypothetical protein
MKLNQAFVAASVLGLVSAFCPAPSQATLMTELFQGATITAHDKLFSNFTLVDIQSVNGGFANLGLVDVQPLVDDPLNPGIKFTAPIDGMGTPFGHDGLSSVTVIFEFAVETTTGLPLIKDNSLLVNGWVFDAHPNAFIQITELVLDASGNSLGDKRVIARNGDTPDSGNPNHFDALDFSPQAKLHVRKTIDIVGPEFNDGARLTMFVQRFSQVPEPSSLAVAGALCLWLVACRRWPG